MKKRYMPLFLVFLMILMAALTGCGTSTSVDDQFKADLMKGLSARWDLTDKEDDDSDTAADYEAYINAELDVVSKYKDETFEDEELGELAKEYIDVLEQGLDTLDDYGNSDKWYASYSEVYDNRAELLVKLNEKLDIQFESEDDQDNFNGLLSAGKVVVAVRELMNTTKFEKTASDYGWKTYTAVVENTTDETFDYFSFEIKLFDKDGVTIENQSAYTENWAPGDKAKFTFETDESFSKMEISNCEYYY